MAIKYYKQLDIQLKNFTTSSEDLATIYFKIGYRNDCKQDFKKAKINYHKALEYATLTHPDLGQIYYYLASIYNDYNETVYYNIAVVHDDQKNCKLALKFYKIALNTTFQNEEKDEDLLIRIYNNI